MVPGCDAPFEWSVPSERDNASQGGTAAEDWAGPEVSSSASFALEWSFLPSPTPSLQALQLQSKGFPGRFLLLTESQLSSLIWVTAQ